MSLKVTANLKRAYNSSGLSAYEVAVKNGFEGTEEEWLESLKCEAGLSAYQVALDNGFEGTEEEWLASLQGETGETGATGETGKSAYQVALDNGFEGTEEEWLESLRGETGETGATGETGKSAYQIALDNGFEGTEAEWLESIKGKDGEKGETGADGKSGTLVSVNGVTVQEFDADTKADKAKTQSELNTIKNILAQSCGVQWYTASIEHAYDSRATADGANVVDSSIAILEKVEGNSVATSNQIDISQASLTSSPSTSINITNINGNVITITSGELYNSNGGVSLGVTLAQLCPYLKAGETYYLNADVVGDNVDKIIYLNGVGSWGYGSSKEITQEMLNATVMLRGCKTAGVATISNLRITKNADTLWSPFVKGLKSASFKGTSSIVSKNLFNGELINGHYNNANFALEAAKGFYSLKVYLPAGTYCMQSNADIVFVRQILDGVYKTNGVSPFTIQNDGWVGISFRRSDRADLDSSDKIWITRGDTPKEYDTYKVSNLELPESIPTPLGTTIDFENKKITNYGVTLVLTGAENWKVDNTFELYGVEADNIVPTVENGATGICTDAELGWGKHLLRIGLNNKRNIKWVGILEKLGYAVSTVDERAESLGKFKAWLAERYASGNPVTIRYVSSELQSETPFTDEQIASLNFVTDDEGNNLGAGYKVSNQGMESVQGNEGAEYGAVNTLTQNYVILTEGE